MGAIFDEQGISIGEWTEYFLDLLCHVSATVDSWSNKGSRKSIRPSRKFAEICKLNIEVKWLLTGLEPDFRTISDFRKNNVDCLKKTATVESKNQRI